MTVRVRAVSRRVSGGESVAPSALVANTILLPMSVLAACEAPNDPRRELCPNSRRGCCRVLRGIAPVKVSLDLLRRHLRERDVTHHGLRERIDRAPERTSRGRSDRWRGSRNEFVWGRRRRRMCSRRWRSRRWGDWKSRRRRSKVNGTGGFVDGEAVI